MNLLKTLQDLLLLLTRFQIYLLKTVFILIIVSIHLIDAYLIRNCQKKGLFKVYIKKIVMLIGYYLSINWLNHQFKLVS